MYYIFLCILTSIDFKKTTLLPQFGKLEEFRQIQQLEIKEEPFSNEDDNSQNKSF